MDRKSAEALVKRLSHEEKLALMAFINLTKAKREQGQPISREEALQLGREARERFCGQ